VEVDDAALEATLVQEREVCAQVVRQCAFAATHEDRIEEQLALVDEACGDRLAGEFGTTYRDVGSGSRFKLADRTGG
jgi:hypothetical protein